jgi:diguanylate cyclase (GGDEF)-like protein/PAS domain S-box-containing protein
MNYLPKKVLFLSVGEPNGLFESSVRECCSQKDIKIDFILNTEDTFDTLVNKSYDIFLLDFELNSQKTFEILRKLQESRPVKNVIIIADEKHRDLYTQAMEAGACDFLVKQMLDMKSLERSVYYSFRHSRILAQLRESQSKYQDLVEHLPAMFYISEIVPPYTQIYASPLFAKFGYEIKDWLGVENMWQSVLHPDDKEWVLEETNRAMANGEETNYEYRIIAKNGDVIWVHDTGHFYHAADGETVYWQGLMSDITDRKIAQQKLIQKVQHDELTGLKNRSSFIEKLETAIEKFEKDSAQTIAVFLLDMDKFKIINDTLGHLTGDQFLIEVSRRLENSVGDNGIVSRLSGDEFAVLIEGVNDKKIEKLAQSITRSLSLPVDLNGYEFSSSASIGITILDEDQKTASEVLRNADSAMYFAKSSGKNCYKYYDGSMYDDKLRLVELEKQLRHALEREEFSLHFQPIFCLETEKISRIEALMRWNNVTYGEIQPDEFIPIAEEADLMDSIGQWLLEESCKQLKQWQKLFPAQENLVMCINISAKQIIKGHFTESITDILEKFELEPQNLCLEIDEKSLMENEDYIVEKINALYQLGVGFSIEDFGRGYSSFIYLHKFPIKEIKIDNCFISNIDNDQKSLKIVRTIISLARSLDFRIIAEGVETKSQFKLLKDLGCDFGQGFHFAKPMPASELEVILQKEKSSLSKSKFSVKAF